MKLKKVRKINNKIKIENIKIDYDADLGYEMPTFFGSIIRSSIAFLLNNLPSRTRGLIKKSHVSAKKVIEKATTHEAIEVLYKFGEPKHSKTLLQKFFHYIWFSTYNSKAVRNRLRMVTREIRKSIKEQALNGKKVKMLSIASGSARAILNAVYKEKDFLKERGINVTFLDKNPKANEYSKSLVKEMKFPDSYTFNWITDTISNFPKYLNNDFPNIVEIVGLLDYFDAKAVEKTMRLVYDNLEDGGVLIVSNIVDNIERDFVTNVVGWKMIYKYPEEFYEIAVRVGFNPDSIKILYEPFKIHFLLIAKK